MAIFGAVYGMSRALVNQSAQGDDGDKGTALDQRIVAELSGQASGGRPRLVVSTPKFESGVSLPFIGKSIIVRGSYGLASGLQQLGRAGRTGQPDAEAVLLCRREDHVRKVATKAGAVRGINVLHEL